jgi:hypothetical protein
MLFISLKSYELALPKKEDITVSAKKACGSGKISGLLCISTADLANIPLLC